MSFESRKRGAKTLFEDRFAGSEIGTPLIYLEDTDSTNTFTLDNSLSLPHGSVVIAESQTSGRGRKGREWYSAPLKGLYLTVLLKTDIPQSRKTQLNLIASLAAFEAVIKMVDDSELLDGIELKWPNDIIYRSTKLCGVLSESRASSSLVSPVAVGIGINLNHAEEDFPGSMGSGATSLLMIDGKERSVSLTAAAVVEQFNFWYERFKAGNSDIIEAWEARSPSAKGAGLKIISDEGEFHAVSEGLDENGFLIVRRYKDRLQRILSADIVSVRKE